MNTSQRNARGEASRQAILSATVQLVSRYGYDSTTISRIVKETGRPASSIYWQFKNKDELITTALESSYSPAPTAARRWARFDPGRPVVEQLITELVPELPATETEAFIRVGIMLALEGAASDSQVQIPFRSRRQRIQHRIEEWWRNALGTPRSNPAVLTEEELHDKASRLGKLTLAFLDGHYISDVMVDEGSIAPRASLLAHVLEGAFEHTLTECDGLPRNDAPSPAPSPEASLPPDEELLRATRYLVAEHGYEGATVSRICTRSGMQRSSLYWRYKDKDALIKAAVADPFIDLLRPLAELPVDTDDWLTTLSALLVDFTRRISEQPDTVKAGLLLKLKRWDSPTSAGSAVLSGAIALENSLAEWFDEVLPAGDGQTPAGVHLAWMLMRLCDGIMLDLTLWQRGVVFATPHCLHAILSQAVEPWYRQMQLQER